MTRRRWCCPLGLCVAAAVFLPTALVAQSDVEALGVRAGVRPPPGFYDVLRADPTAFQFSEDNGWIRRGRGVAAARNRQRAVAAGTAHAPAAPLADGVLTGEMTLAVFLILYANTDSAATVAELPREDFVASMFGTETAPPYSLNTFYQELSNTLLGIQGGVFDWTRVSSADSVYEAGCSGLCSASNTPFTDMIAEVVAAHDGAADYGQFDNDGADGVPNSGDDDGYVDAIVLFHPEVDGACGSNGNLWAHRWSYRGRRGADLFTNDDAAVGGKIKVRDYIVQGGQGGPSGCAPNEPQAIGVVSHETGHLFGLPDLYDTSNDGEGIGHWGLMGSGNWRLPSSPAHMSAWSKGQLGWVTEVLVQNDVTLEISPIIESDTAFVLPIPNRNEYFLLENRQAIGADAFIAAPGLLIWHADSVLIRSRSSFNRVNASQPYALALEQADGRNDLQDGANRGDASDPYPGSGSRTAFGSGTIPSSATNDGASSYVAVDSITQEPSSAITVQIRFELPTFIAASREFAVFRLDGEPLTAFEQRLTPGTDHTLDIDDVQLVDGSRRRYTWRSWSNGEPRFHTFIASQRGDSIIADVTADYLLQVSRVGIGGSVAADGGVDIVNGELVAEGTQITLTATVDSAQHLFEGWSGDTASTDPTLVLDMPRPFELTATFAAPLVADSDDPPAAIMGASYNHQLGARGGIQTFSWNLVSGALPFGLSLRTDGLVSGIPRRLGEATFTVRVRSGSQAVEERYTLGVSAPALDVQDVVRHLLGITQVLTIDENRYLDLVGNQNGGFDLGDFLAWVETTGATVSAADIADVLRRASLGSPAAGLDSTQRRRQ